MVFVKGSDGCKLVTTKAYHVPLLLLHGEFFGEIYYF